MNFELLQGMVDIVFKGNLLYLSPVLFVVMVTLFSDRIVEMVSAAFSGSGNKNGRR